MLRVFRVASLLLGLTLLFNACSEDPVAPPVPPIAPPLDKEITTIADLKAKWVSEDITIAEETYIKGVVTLTPEKQNITNFVTYIQDATGGIAITLDNDSQGILEVGMEITVGGEGIKLSKFNGLFQFGILKLETGYLQGTKEVAPREVTITDILDKKYTGELVMIKNVEFAKAGVFSGNNTLTDCTSSATVYTRSQATFAGEALPTGNGTFIGVVSIFNNPQLLVRNPAELQMTGERCSAGTTPDNNSTNVCGDNSALQSSVFEAFNGAVANQSYANTGWRNVIVQGDRNWSGKEFEGNKYVQATGHNAAAGTYESWLITPPLDVTNAASKIARFKTAQAFWRETTTFEVFVLKCEGDATTQTKLNPTLATQSTTQYEFVSSGDIDLSSYSGIVHIGFKYVGLGGASNSTTWCIDDFEFNNTVTTVSITSTAVTSVASGAEYKYDVTTQVINASGVTTITVTGLPSWASYTDNGDGTASITGTAPEVTEDESYNVVITATNNNVEAQQSYTLILRAPGEEGSNLVTNGGFEDWTDALPVGWQNATYNFNITKETSIVHSGANSIKHTYTDKTAKIQQEVPVTGGKTYEISYWYLDNDPNAKSRMWSFWLNGENKTLDDHVAELRNEAYTADNAQWVNVVHTLTAPESAVKFRLEVRTYKESSGGGFIYYDDFSIVEK